jgi:hypothetical protein
VIKVSGPVNITFTITPKNGRSGLPENRNASPEYLEYEKVSKPVSR